MRKLIKSMLGVSLLMFLTFAVYAQESKPSEDINLQNKIVEEESAEKIENDLFLTGGKLIISNEVKDNSYLIGKEISTLKPIGGNLWGLGMEIETDARIGQSIFACGLTVNIKEDVKGDIFIIARTVNITGEISGNAYIIAEQVFVDSDISDDVNIVASRVIFNKSAGEDLRIKADEVYINSDVVEGDMDISAYKAYITDNLKLEGRMFINSKEVEDIKNYKDYGLIEYKSSSIPKNLSELPPIETLDYLGLQKLKNIGFATFGIGAFLMILGDVLAAYVLFRVFTSCMSDIVENFKLKKLKIGLIYGLIFIMISIFLLLITALSFIGLPLFVTVCLLLMLVLLLGKYALIYKLGSLIVERIQPRLSGIMLNCFVGELLLIVVLLLLGSIPIAGAWLVLLLIVLMIIWIVGAVVQANLENIRRIYKRT